MKGLSMTVEGGRHGKGRGPYYASNPLRGGASKGCGIKVGFDDFGEIRNAENGEAVCG